MVKKVVLFVFVSLFVFSGAYAMNLSSSDMERFITTTEALAPYFDELDDDRDDDDDDDDEEEDDIGILDVESTKQLILEDMSGKPEVRNIVGSNGYASMEDYAEQYAHIIRAYIASSARGQIGELESSMASMSPEQRQSFQGSPVFQMVSEMKIQLASVPESHIQAITPYMPQLQEVFGHDDDEDDFL
ncbi:hypothetical protein BDD21_0127 [Thiocapsa rosea]|uniref:Uncharacterized protein n=2 Tax=Thiocapsa rosea TaxID=69360 RepID=A0A495V025_9GAMM|nr:hypothetical protein BDD21_0127 [Thiocapsa rosea]